MIKKLLVAIAVAIGVITVTPAPANAALSNCTGAQYLCLWSGINFSGNPMWYNTMSLPLDHCYNLTGSVDNNTESILNETSHVISFYSNAGGSGFLFTLAPGSGISNLYYYPGPYPLSNQISSVCRDS